jgi:hypothetical protein
MLNKRNATHDTSRVPPIVFSDEIDIKGHEQLIADLITALTKKFAPDSLMASYLEPIADAVKQTIHFLKHINALTEYEYKSGTIELWKEMIVLEPFYEGVACELRACLIKKHFPSMYAAIQEGKIYSHHGLTVVAESAVYTLEMLFKLNALQEVEIVAEEPVVKKWVSDYNIYIKTHKRELEALAKKREKNAKAERDKMDKLMKQMAKGGFPKL